MRISFRDGDGTRGVITQDLDVCYEARWESEVKSCVEEVRQELQSNGEDIRVETAANQLIIDLPEEIPIHEIERMPEADN